MVSRNQELQLNRKELGERHTLLLPTGNNCSNSLLFLAYVISPATFSGYPFLSSSSTSGSMSLNRTTAARLLFAELGYPDEA